MQFKQVFVWLKNVCIEDLFRTPWSKLSCSPQSGALKLNRGDTEQRCAREGRWGSQFFVRPEVL